MRYPTSAVALPACPNRLALLCAFCLTGWLAVPSHASDGTPVEGRGWDLIAQDQPVSAQSWFARRANADRADSSYKVGYAFALVLRGDIDQAGWAVERALVNSAFQVEQLRLPPDVIDRIGRKLDGLERRYQAYGFDTCFGMVRGLHAYLDDDLELAQDQVLQLETTGRHFGATAALGALVERRRLVLNPPPPPAAPPAVEAEPQYTIQPVVAPVPVIPAAEPDPAPVAAAPAEPAPAEPAAVEEEPLPPVEVDFNLIRDRLQQMGDAMDRFSQRLAEDINQVTGPPAHPAAAEPTP
ncbi:MAG: hypothetical protein AAFX76_07360 [Planctomycetota bacterium]